MENNHVLGKNAHDQNKEPQLTDSAMHSNIGDDVPYIQKVKANNDQLGKEIVTSWPLPDTDAKSLFVAMQKLITDGMVPLKPAIRHPVSLDENGYFTVEFELQDWTVAQGGHPSQVKAAMINKVAKVMCASHVWRQEADGLLIFKSTSPTKLINFAARPTDAFLRCVNIIRNSKASILLAWLKKIEDLYNCKISDEALPEMDDKMLAFGKRILAYYDVKFDDFSEKLKKVFEDKHNRFNLALTYLNDTIKPALKKIDVVDENMAVLLLGTAFQESKLSARKQIGGGPALSFFQVEKETHRDNWLHYLNYGDKALRKNIMKLIPDVDMPRYNASMLDNGDIVLKDAFEKAIIQLEKKLEHDDAYAICMAYCKYKRTSDIPDKNALDRQAHVWKTHYNVSAKGGSEEDYKTAWTSFMGHYKFS